LNVNPDSHDFSVVDLNISYGYRARAKVSLPLLIFLAVIVPILIITTLSLYPFSFISRSARGRPSSAQLRSLNASLLGLGVSLATATVVLNVKNLAGIPRPDFLERCQPDVDNIAAYTVGGSYGRSVSDRWVMVTDGICQADWRDVNEGFRSFPSGYATSMFLHSDTRSLLQAANQ
jgi:membrane-associated phospholipid phosphatase